MGRLPEHEAAEGIAVEQRPFDPFGVEECQGAFGEGVRLGLLGL
jgi:hypothetical protein